MSNAEPKLSDYDLIYKNMEFMKKTYDGLNDVEVKQPKKPQLISTEEQNKINNINTAIQLFNDALNLLGVKTEGMVTMLEIKDNTIVYAVQDSLQGMIDNYTCQVGYEEHLWLAKNYPSAFLNHVSEVESDDISKTIFIVG